MANLPLVVQRLLTAAVLGLVFMVAASVFVPDWTRADPELPPEKVPLTGPLLGTIEGEIFLVEIYGSEEGPRYTVKLARDGAVVGESLTAEEVSSRFPELPLETIDLRPGNETLLMMADEPH